MVQKNTILVIEDEKSLQEAIKIKLEKYDFEVVTARSAEEALVSMESLKKIDVIWLDHYLLGKENGLDFVAKIKGREDWKKIPIFVVTNTASADKIKTYISFGVDKYYVKAENRLDQIIEDIKKELDKEHA